MFRGGNQSMILAIAIMLSALTIFNADRRRSAGVELDYGHHDRLLVDEVNELHVKMMGVPRYGGGDDQRVRFQLRPMLPSSSLKLLQLHPSGRILLLGRRIQRLPQLRSQLVSCAPLHRHDALKLGELGARKTGLPQCGHALTLLLGEIQLGTLGARLGARLLRLQRAVALLLPCCH